MYKPPSLGARLTSLGAGVLLAGAVLATPVKAAELVTNGGFETGDFTGWTLTGNTGFTGVGTSPVFDGLYAAYLGPVGSLGYLSQTLSTIAGQSYTLSFAVSGDQGAPGSFEAFLDGGSVTSFTSSSFFSLGWSVISGIFTAATNSTVISFAFFQDPAYWYLDAVSVTGGSRDVPVPIAGAGLPAVLGLMGYGLWRRRASTPAT